MLSNALKTSLYLLLKYPSTATAAIFAALFKTTQAVNFAYLFIKSDEAALFNKITDADLGPQATVLFYDFLAKLPSASQCYDSVTSYDFSYNLPEADWPDGPLFTRAFCDYTFDADYPYNSVFSANGTAIFDCLLPKFAQFCDSNQPPTVDYAALPYAALAIPFMLGLIALFITWKHRDSRQEAHLVDAGVLEDVRLRQLEMKSERIDYSRGIIERVNETGLPQELTAVVLNYIYPSDSGIYQDRVASAVAEAEEKKEVAAALPAPALAEVSGEEDEVAIVPLAPDEKNALLNITEPAALIQVDLNLIRQENIPKARIRSFVSNLMILPLSFFVQIPLQVIFTIACAHGAYSKGFQQGLSLPPTSDVDRYDDTRFTLNSSATAYGFAILIFGSVLTLAANCFGQFKPGDNWFEQNKKSLCGFVVLTASISGWTAFAAELIAPLSMIKDDGLVSGYACHGGSTGNGLQCIEPHPMEIGIYNNRYWLWALLPIMSSAPVIKALGHSLQTALGKIQNAVSFCITLLTSLEQSRLLHVATDVETGRQYYRIPQIEGDNVNRNTVASYGALQMLQRR